MNDVIKKEGRRDNDYSMYLEHRDESTLWMSKIKSKKVGNPFAVLEDNGAFVEELECQFVIGQDGNYKCVFRDKEEGQNGEWCTCVWEGYTLQNMPEEVMNAAKELGLSFVEGEFIKEEK